jgi:uncharacterized surface protein with fasciclin (FAS1) repeats
MRPKHGNTARPAGLLAAGAVAGVVAVTAAACGSSAPAAAPAASPAASHQAASPSPSMTESSAAIGTDCGMIPAVGMGSMHGMASEPVVTAARHNPLLTTLASEVQKAGLTGTLDSAGSITVFAPDNQAFAKLTQHDMTMMSGAAELARILKYHVVTGRVTPAELSSGMTLKTLEGSQLRTSKMGSTYEVNSAAITCGNLHTANATVYIINTVLMPMH